MSAAAPVNAGGDTVDDVNVPFEVVDGMGTEVTFVGMEILNEAHTSPKSFSKTA
jgi:hypothetical protein